MKKILTFIIIIAMTLSLGVPAFAATPATVTVASPAAAVNPGSTVDVAVTIADNPGMDVMKLKFSYDTAALTLKDIELGNVMTGTFTKNLDKAVALLEAAGTTKATGNGTLVTLKFEVKSTATTGNYTIGFLVADAVNRNEERVALTTQAGTVSVAVPVTTYTVRFNANGGTGTMADVTGVPAGAYTLPANGFTAPAGKQFKGWSTGASGAVIEGTTYNVTGDVTLYAIWENKPHTHTYSTEWSTDSANHWHECTCGDKKDLAPHVDANNDHNCDVCGKKMSDHTGGTATCKDKATCTICGQKYGSLAGHNYKTEWSTDETNHWHECSVCGDKKDEAAHVDANKDHNCDVCGKKMSDHTGGTATCKDKATCTICGQKYGELAAHSYKTEWSTDETNHWHECSVCGDKKDEAAHIPGAAATETTPQTCTICGYVIKAALGHTHNFNQKNTSETYLKSAATCAKKAVYYYSCTCGEKGTETFESGKLAAHAYKTTWSNDNASHWHSCYVCGDKKDEEVHIDKNKDHNCDVCGKKMTDHTGGTATCKDRATCSICGEKYGSLAGHVYKTIWSYDEINHWHECSVCGSKKDEEAHIPGEEATETTHQTCTVCGYVIKAAIGHVHSYTEKNTDEKYLKTPATCTAKAVYYYSCSCGNKGTETFESGDVLAHSWGTVWVSDGSKHWHECTVCKTKGDEADHAFEWKIDKEATVTEAGAKHEECKICGYNKTAVAIDKLAPSITDGSNAKWGKGDENGLTFKSDAAFSDFVEVLVDGKTVAAENYEKREGSIVIQLKASYLATLAAGEHTLTIRSASGDATTKFTIEAEVVPPAPESTNAWVWIVVGVVALGACAAVVVFIIRKRKKA
ncbi:putative uncharacterized protein [Candidatus Apopatosoma intestinale]|nr:putative uncharacterized protein [Candidatus Apopatosoma intestinale]